MKKEQLEQDSEYSFPYHYIPQYKNGFTQNYNWTWSVNYISAIEFILDEVQKDKKLIQSIADVGCGDGRLTRELTDTLNDKEVIGIDYSSRAISLAKALNIHVDYQSKDIINDNFTKKFDAITLVEVFEHIPLDMCSKFVKALVSLLNDNGVIYLTVPHINKSVSYKHFQHFSYSSLVKYFENDFDIVEKVFFDKKSRFLFILKKLMNNGLFIVNNKNLNNIFYNYYKKKFFYTNEKSCSRIYLKLKKKSLK